MKLLSRLSRLYLAVYVSYLVLTLVVTWPLITVFSTRLIGHPFGDSYEYVGLIWWIKHALQTGVPLFVQPLLAYPDGLSAGLLWSVPLQSFPSWLFAFFMPLPAAFNLSILLTLALNGWSAFYLSAYLTKNHAASWLAGLVFMTFPTFQGQLAAGHIGLLQLWAIPLYVYTLFRLRESGERHYILWAALFFVLSLLGSNLILVYALFPVTILFLLSLLFRREWANLKRVLIAVSLGGFVALIFLIPNALDTLSAPSQLRERNDIVFSADLLAVVSPSFQHPLFSNLDYPHRVLGVDPFEKIAYVGIVAGLLALFALWRRPESRWWFWLGLFAWIGSWGPVLKILDTPLHLSIEGYDTLIALPWLAAGKIPLLNISRTPARFDFTLALAVAMLVGYGAAALSNSKLLSRVLPFKLSALNFSLVMLLLTLLILCEYPFFWKNGIPDMPTISGIVPAPIAALAQRSDIRAVFDIPWDHLLTDKEAMFLQTGHGHPLIAGHILRRTPVDPAKLTLLQDTLNPALLNEAGVDIIVLHKNWDDAEGNTEAFTRAQLGQPFYEDNDYAVFNAPKSNAAPMFITGLPDKTVVTDHTDAYFYVPSPGWVPLTSQLQADGRDISLSLNNVQIQHWHVEGGITTETPLYLPETGYYTLTFSLNPPCPVNDNPALMCRSLSVSNLTLSDFLPAEPPSPIEFAGGISLIASHFSHIESELSIWLDWQFDAVRSESAIRFVHVMDAQGNLVAQSDQSLGNHATGSSASEAIHLTLAHDLPVGNYRIYVGWYAYPDTTPFPILSDTPNPKAGILEIGTFTYKSH